MAPSVLDNELEDFDVDDFNDPFAASGDENAAADPQSKKRDADASGLGIEEAVAVHKKPRIPNVKLDEARLLSDNGMPKLRKKARELKFKGKGHEYSDTEKLLSFYQLWLDDLFPKGKFLDSLAMVERAGHKKPIVMARLNWINEGKPRAHRGSSSPEADPYEERQAAIFPARVAPIFENQVRASHRPNSSILEDGLLAEEPEDIYDATPRAPRTVPLEGGSLFGDGGAAPNNGEPDEDDLDALMAEEESQRGAPKSIFGNGQTAPNHVQRQQALDEDDLDELEAMMADVEAESRKRNGAPASGPKPSRPVFEDEDDLDAFMAEAEAEGTKKKTPTLPKPSEAAGASNSTNADEEEAMAELDGLW